MAAYLAAIIVYLRPRRSGNKCEGDDDIKSRSLSILSSDFPPRRSFLLQPKILSASNWNKLSNKSEKRQFGRFPFSFPLRARFIRLFRWEGKELRKIKSSSFVGSPLKSKVNCPIGNKNASSAFTFFQRFTRFCSLHNVWSPSEWYGKSLFRRHLYA